MAAILARRVAPPAADSVLCERRIPECGTHGLPSPRGEDRLRCVVTQSNGLIDRVQYPLRRASSDAFCIAPCRPREAMMAPLAAQGCHPRQAAPPGRVVARREPQAARAAGHPWPPPRRRACRVARLVGGAPHGPLHPPPRGRIGTPHRGRDRCRGACAHGALDTRRAAPPRAPRVDTRRAVPPRAPRVSAPWGASAAAVGRAVCTRRRPPPVPFHLRHGGQRGGGGDGRRGGPRRRRWPTRPRCGGTRSGL